MFLCVCVLNVLYVRKRLQLLMRTSVASCKTHAMHAVGLRPTCYYTHTHTNTAEHMCTCMRTCSKPSYDASHIPPKCSSEWHLSEALNRGQDGNIVPTPTLACGVVDLGFRDLQSFRASRLGEIIPTWLRGRCLQLWTFWTYYTQVLSVQDRLRPRVLLRFCLLRSCSEKLRAPYSVK